MKVVKGAAMKKKIVILLVVVLCCVAVLSACNVSYNPMKDEDFMKKVMYLQMLLAGQSFENETYFAPQPDSAYKGWKYELVDDGVFKKTYKIKTNTHFSAYGNKRVVSAYEYSGFMHPVTLALKNGKLIVSNNVDGTFTLDGKKFSNYTSKDYILRNSSLCGNALPSDMYNDKYALKTWMMENCGAPPDYDFYFDTMAQITCRFAYPVTRGEMVHFLYYRDDDIKNIKALVKVGEEDNDILLQSSWRILMSIEAQLEFLASSTNKDGVNMIAQSPLFDLPNFNIEELYDAVRNTPACHVGFICELPISHVPNLFNHINELGENNGMEIVEIKCF